jgi:tetratricopeptide (TPR) repeat protein
MPQDPEIRILLAKTSLLAGEPVEALAVLRNVHLSRKGNAERLDLMGQAEALTGNLNAAEKALAYAVKEFPSDSDYVMSYAWLRQRQGKYFDAIRLLAKARLLDPKSPAIPFRLAVSYYYLRQYPEAEKFCREALRLNPDYAAGYLLLGMSQRRQKNVDGALSSLERALSLNPREELFHRELGETLLESAHIAAAKKELDEALVLDSRDAAGYFWRAKLLAAQGADRQAIANLKAAVELNPNYSAAYGALVELYRKDGQAQEAAKALEQQKRIKGSPKALPGGDWIGSVPDASC